MWRDARKRRNKNNPAYANIIRAANGGSRGMPPSRVVVDTMGLSTDQPSFLSQNVALPAAGAFLKTQSISEVTTNGAVHKPKAIRRVRDSTKQAIPELPVPFPDPQIDRIVTNLVEERELGRGSFGRVVAGRTIDGQGNPLEVAKKIMLVDIGDDRNRVALMQELRKEITMLRLVVPYKIYNAYIETDPQTGGSHVVLLMELIHGKNGFDATMETKTYLTPSQAKDLLAYLLSVAGCMDTLGAVHRDIKPENLIYRRNPAPGGKDEVVLVDWGLGCKYIDPANFPRCNILSAVGTPLYISPYMYAAASENVAALEGLTRRITPCLSNKTKKAAAKALKSRNLDDYKALLGTPEVSHLLLRMNDLWSIAFTVMDMAGVAPTGRETEDFAAAFGARAFGVVAFIISSANLMEMANFLKTRGFDPNTIVVLLRILDYHGRLTPVQCPFAAELLSELYGRKTPYSDKDMCAVTRRQSDLPAGDRETLEQMTQTF